MSDNNNGATNLLFFLAGASIGAVVALLYAPQSGKETREYIAERAEESRDYLKERGKEIREQAEDYVEKSKDLVAAQVERGKDLVAKQKEQLSAALEAVKDGYKEAKRAH
ncbi:MAG TPA: YtxH domain-containing protein [Terriglobia bacterium]|nr:YtxH domain-containing protein [Terriglobia bacterium]